MSKPIEDCKADARFMGVATIKASGEDLAVAFRRPAAREWLEYEAARQAYQVALRSGTATSANMREMHEKSEDLVVRIAISHTPEELQDLNERHLGIFFDLGTEMAEAIDKVRAGSGKGSTPPGKS